MVGREADRADGEGEGGLGSPRGFEPHRYLLRLEEPTSISASLTGLMLREPDEPSAASKSSLGRGLPAVGLEPRKW